MEKQQKAEEKKNKKKNSEQIIIEVKAPYEDMVPLANEEEEDVPEAFDNTLENLMTIEETNGVSEITGEGAQQDEGKPA